VPLWLEKEAYDALSASMPGVELVPVPADDMIELEGAVHCLALGLNRRE
jgi:agmatine/peptidylarginine deiminase